MNISEIIELANDGDSYGQFLLGVLYENGLGRNKDIHESFKWYKAAAERDLAIAKYCLANLIFNNPDISPKEAGFKLLLDAAIQGYPSAECLVGIAYEQGIGTDSNQESALAWLQKAANVNHVPAILYLASKYKDGLGLPVNIEQAEALYLRAANLGSAEAAFLLSEIYFKKNNQEKVKQGLQWLQFSFERKDRNAARMLGYIYVDGLYGVKKDENKAAEYFKIADQLDENWRQHG